MLPAAGQGGLPPHPPPPLLLSPCGEGHNNNNSTTGSSSAGHRSRSNGRNGNASASSSSPTSSSSSPSPRYVEAWSLAPLALWDDRYCHYHQQQHNHPDHRNQYQQRRDPGQDGNGRSTLNPHEIEAHGGSERGPKQGKPPVEPRKRESLNPQSSTRSNDQISSNHHSTHHNTDTANTTTSGGFGESLASLGTAGLRGLWGGVKATAIATAAGAAAASQRALDPALPLPQVTHVGTANEYTSISGCLDFDGDGAGGGPQSSRLDFLFVKNLFLFLCL